MDYPRVTEILSAYTNYDSVPKDILKNAAARGTTVHAICANLAKGVWVPDSMIQEEYQGYIDSFKLWAASQVEEYLVVEKRYKDDELEYTGQLDYIIVGKDGKKYLVDLKTSAKPQRTYPVQMAAYELLIRAEHQIEGAILVYLDKDGDFPDCDLIHDLKEELSVFLSALECWKYFHKRKKR